MLRATGNHKENTHLDKMYDEKMIQRCKLSSAANLFLNSHNEYDDNEPVPLNHPTAPYYDGHNWKSAESVAKELEHHKQSAVDEYFRIKEQMEDSFQRIELGYKNAKRVDQNCKAKNIAQRGSVRATHYPAYLQTPFILNPTPNRVSPWPRGFENPQLSEHTGMLGLPVNNDHEDMDQGALHLEFIRANADSNGRNDQQYSPQDYHDHILEHSHNPNSPNGNKPLLESVALFLFNRLPQTMKRIRHEITKGTDDEKMMKAEILLSKLKNIFRRNQLKRKLIKTANKHAMKAQRLANLYIGYKKSASLREQIEQFEYIKERGGEGYLEVNHHLSAVPRYMDRELSGERLLGTGLSNGIGPGNGVKRKRMGSVWRNRDPYGFHSSLRIVSNASSDFQEEYVTKATYPPPNLIHTVDGGAERMAEESIPEDIDSDEIYSETSSDHTSPIDISSDETSLETKSDEWVTEEDKTMEDETMEDITMEDITMEDEQDEVKNGDE
ncbi:hypothetical protein BOTNAR_0487g00010 [Botryotinia narcissicola]|uniref:Uncharacterized protein n=1 Tax=Botryotinia narcissicola TaxID=278944 RepID=A0A4Z1HT98_9HELO|nr:hypothetical protein BOTNAR_0487g00010 [Botryotinia narcissicola]